MVERRFADLHAHRGFAHGQPIRDVLVGTSELILGDGWLTPALASACCSRRQARTGMLTDQVAFELTKAPKMWTMSRPPGVVVSIASVSNGT